MVLPVRIAVPDPRTVRLAFAAAVFACLGWATLYTAAKTAMREVTGLMVAFDRATVATFTLTIIVILRAGGLRPGLRRLADTAGQARWGVVSLGIVNFAGTSVLAMTAQQFLPASVNGLINNLAPLWLSIFAAMMGTAVRPVMLVAGSGLAAVGVAIVLLGDTLLASFTGGSGATMPDADATTWIGVAISLTGSVLICYQNYLARKVVQGLDPVAITALGSACGSLIVGLVLATGTGGTLSGFGTVSVPTALVLVWLGTVSTAFNFTLWTYALSQLPVARIVNLQYLVPPLGVVVSVVFLGEPVGPGLGVGAAAILVGIILAQRGTAMARA